MKSHRTLFTTTDKLLLLLGLVGFVIYLFVLPRVHTDAASDLERPKEEVLDMAQAFAFNQGYDISGFRWQAWPIRSMSLLDSLQANTEETSFELLQNPDFDALPIYGWEVIGRKGNPITGSPSEIIMKLGKNGEVWHFNTARMEMPAPKRQALLLTPTWQSDSTVVLDSLDTGDLVARFWSVRWDDPNIPGGNRPPQPIPPRPPDSVRVKVFDRADAETIAQYYTGRSLLNQYNLSVSDVFKRQGQDRNDVYVSLEGTVSGNMRVQSTLELTTSGILKSINTLYNSSASLTSEEQEEADNNFNFNFGDISDIATTLQVLVFILLAIFTFILFLRRLNARLIDVKAALQDAIWGGLFSMLAIASFESWSIYLNSGNIWQGAIMALVVTLAAGTAGAFAVFIISCATDSIARAVWPKRLATLTLARNARFFNTAMGNSLIKSIGITGILIGLTTSFLFFSGPSAISLGTHIPAHDTLSPILSLVSFQGLISMIMCMMVLLSFGSILSSKDASRTIIILFVVFLAMLLQIGPSDYHSPWLQWIFSGIIGLVLIFTFFQVDYFAVFWGYTLYVILWQISPHWLIWEAGNAVDVFIGISLIPVTLLIGFIGLISKKEVEEADQYVPAYLNEMAQQERLQGELEIARQVQSSLLPRRMPTIKGIDLAAMCLPAQEVGGDYFDFVKLDEHRTALVIGDVSGKGIQAGFYMTLTKGFLHAVCQSIDSPADVLTKVNELFCKNVSRGTFISLIYGIFDSQHNTFTFARAGHDPILFNSEKLDTPAFYQPRGMAIGLTPDKTFKNTIQDETIHLDAGDILVFYTDGVTEAVNHQLEQFGIERLAEAVTFIGTKKSARQVLQEVTEHIQTFVKSASRADDMTMVVLKIAPQQTFKSAKEDTSQSHTWLEHEL